MKNRGIFKVSMQADDISPLRGRESSHLYIAPLCTRQLWLSRTCLNETTDKALLHPMTRQMRPPPPPPPPPNVRKSEEVQDDKRS